MYTGTIEWDDGRAPPGSIGYMPQDNSARVALTAFEVVLLGRMRSLALRVGRRDLDAAEAAMEEIGIGDLASRRIGELSGGQRQDGTDRPGARRQPARAAARRTRRVRWTSRVSFMSSTCCGTATPRGLTTIAVLHDLNAAARFADRVALTTRGRLIGIGFT